MPRKNLVAEAIATRAEVFKRFRDWVCARNGSYNYTTTGQGWTYHDSSYAVSQDTISNNDYFVIRSTGESGKDDIYMKVTYSATANMIQVQMCQYWNSTTHVGVNLMTAANNWQVADATAGTLYIYATLDYILVFTLIGASQYGALFGLLDDSEYDKTIAISSGAVSAGSNVVVTMDLVPASWVVGGKVVVKDNANMERIIVSAINSLDVTFTSLAASYTSGCKFAKDFPIVCNNATNLLGAYIALFGHNNAKLASISTVVVPVSPGDSGDPDPLDGEFLAAPYEFRDSTVGYLGRFYDLLGMVTTGYAHLQVYSTATGVNYRAVISLNSSAPVLIKEV